MKSGLIQVATITSFGATAADRIAGGFVGTIYIDVQTNGLKLVDKNGEEKTASVGGVPVLFT